MAKDDRNITLTPEEFEDTKEEVRFRTKVLVELKLLRGIRDRVIVLETKAVVLIGAVVFLITGLGTLAWQLITKVILT